MKCQQTLALFDPDFELTVNKLIAARCLYESEQYIDAALLLERYTALAQEDQLSKDRLSIYLWDADLDDRALSQARKCVQSQAEIRSSTLVLLESFSADAAKLIEPYVAEDKSIETRIRSAIAKYLFLHAEHEKSYDFVIRLFETSLARMDDLQVAVLNLIILDKADQALPLLESYSSKENEKADYFGLMAMVKLALGDKPAATDALNTAIKLEPRNEVVAAIHNALMGKAEGYAQNFPIDVDLPALLKQITKKNQKS